MSAQVFTQFVVLSVIVNTYSIEEIFASNIQQPVQTAGESLMETKFVETLDLSARIVLSWELGNDKSLVTFELWAQTLGYVGFGISPNGGMAGADIFIAGVYPDGAPYFSDRFASGNGEPKIDSHQDWNLLEAKENETTTYLKFSRLVDTCDKDEDYPISKYTSRVIWAIGPTDELVKHSMGDRGTRSIRFLQKRPVFNATGLNTWIVGLEELTMPSTETTYWVSFHSFPIKGPQYLVAYDAHLPDENSTKHIHHMVAYICSLPDDGSLDKTIEPLTVDSGFRGNNFELIENPLLFDSCRKLVLASFHKGNELVALPNNVAYKFGNKHEKKLYVLLEAHMTNFEKSEGVLLNYGMKIFFTDKPRQYEASRHGIGYASSGILIPPNTQSFFYSGHCSPSCTSKLDPTGIFIFNVQLHAHMFGKKLKLRHFRNDIELPWIAYEDHFDFNHQQPQMLDEERKVLPGDRLTIECEYDSTRNNGKIVVGGASSNNEMCEAHLWYYPSMVDFHGSWSMIGEEQILAPFNITKFAFTPDYLISNIQIEEPASLRGRLEDSLNNKFNWTDEFIKEFQQRKRIEDQMVGCIATMQEELEEFEAFSYPEYILQYVLNETCN